MPGQISRRCVGEADHHAGKENSGSFGQFPGRGARRCLVHGRRGVLLRFVRGVRFVDGFQQILENLDRTIGLTRLLERQGRLAEARELIRNQPENSSAEARMKIMAEAQLLRDNKKFNEAYELLSEANRQNGEDLDLAYDLAMVAEKLGNITEMERLLRLIIASKPDYHHAYNALGYSLAERNVRLPEARQLVLKALDLAPSDPFILDSLGWVEFRSGNLEEARRILQSAFDAKPDAEIAAHLGEVLWAMNRKSQAIAIWKEGGKLNAQNDTLQETLKRLGVRP